MPEFSRSRHRRSIAARAESLLEASARSGDPIPSEQLEALEREARLVGLLEDRQNAPARKRWPAVMVVVLTLGILSVLLFARVPHTEIALTLRVSNVTFTSEGRQVLSEFTPLAALGAYGLAYVDLPAAAADEVGQAALGSPPLALHLAGAPGDAGRGSVSLSSVLLGPGARVALRYEGAEGRYRLSLQHPETALRVSVHGPVHVGVASAPARVFVYDVPRALALEPAADELDLDLEFTSLPLRDFGRQLQVSELSLSRVDEYVGPDSSVVRRVSTILSGTLHFASLDGRERRLRPGEPLRLGDLAGTIGALELVEKGIQLRFRGRVGQLETGWGDGRRSLMPTLLEWLQARHGVSLLWGSAIYCLGLIFGVMRWWGVNV